MGRRGYWKIRLTADPCNGIGPLVVLRILWEFSFFLLFCRSLSLAWEVHNGPYYWCWGNLFVLLLLSQLFAQRESIDEWYQGWNRSSSHWEIINAGCKWYSGLELVLAAGSLTLNYDIVPVWRPKMCVVWGEIRILCWPIPLTGCSWNNNFFLVILPR